MGFDEGQIVLNSPNGAYYSGQTVVGKLLFQADKPMTFRGIYMKFKGYCKVHWRTSHSRTVNGRRESYHQDHTSEEEYVHMKTYLIGGEAGECTLKPGPYEFPFQCVLPGNCPSSFEGTYGHIRYEIKVIVDRAFKLDKEKKVAVRVMSPINLNAEPYSKEPIQFEFNDSYCCCCMNYGSAHTVIKLPVSGYCPGQVIPIEIGCTNSGSVEIDEVKFSIKKIITFRATHNPATKTEEDKVTRVKKGPVPAGSTRAWLEELPVPALDVYNVATCQFIDIDYEFKVEVCPEGCHSNSDDSRRIIIGSIPLVGFQDNVQNPLNDQMPQMQFVPVTNQPLPSMPMGSPYPVNNAAYPNVTPVPNNQYTNSPYPNSPYENPPATNPAYPATDAPYPVTRQPNPTSTSPYPTSTSPYPTSTSPYLTSTSPYPTSTSPYPTSTTPYPPPYSVNAPNPANVSPYPTSNSPYPSASPYPGANPPYPSEKSPYPTSNPAFPTPQQNMQYPSSNNPGFQQGSFGGSALKTGTVGFVAPTVMPTANPASPMPPPNPYATASAPADFTDGKQ